MKFISPSLWPSMQCYHLNCFAFFRRVSQIDVYGSTSFILLQFISKEWIFSSLIPCLPLSVSQCTISFDSLLNMISFWMDQSLFSLISEIFYVNCFQILWLFSSSQLTLLKVDFSKFQRVEWLYQILFLIAYLRNFWKSVWYVNFFWISIQFI